MDKREFLKTSGVILTGSLVQRYVSAEPQAEHRTNWAGNYEYHAKNLISPKTTEEVQAAVKNSSTLKALGARHSFNNIADNPLNQISLKQLDTMVLDEKAHTVTVGAGVTYGQLAPYIDAKGYALHNLASLRTSPSLALAQQPHTARATRMATCRRQWPRWRLSPRTAK